MAVVDDRGRFLGRLNVVDAFLMLFALALVPLAYGSYLLFRTPPPRLTAVEPATIQHAEQMRITVRGEDLRPYMRIAVGDQQGKTFLFYNATTAEVDLPELPPGVYDVALYDYAQERARLEDALTIAPPPLPAAQVDVVGAFRSVTPEMVKVLSPGMRVGNLGTVQQVGEPLPSIVRALAGPGFVEIPVDAIDVPAVIRVGCQLTGAVGRVQCVAGDVALVADAFLTVPTPAGERPFQIDEVRAPMALTPVEVRVRFRGDPQTLALIDSSALDVGVVRNPLAAGAVVLEAGALTATRDVTLRVPAQRGATGWRYGGADLRSGAAFRFTTTTYDLTGTVLRVTPAEPRDAQDARQ